MKSNFSAYLFEKALFRLLEGQFANGNIAEKKPKTFLMKATNEFSTSSQCIINM